jgi:hypothetical protein
VDTLIGIVLAAVFILPGFVTQELTVRRRPSARADGQIITQRALFYTVIIQLVWSWDTWRLAEDLTGPHWRGHYGEVAVWVVMVLVVSPALLGFSINAILVRAETGGRDLRRIHYALGGRDAREAWDYVFQTLDSGAWVLIRLVASTPNAPVMFIGRYGEKARHAQSPAPHDVFFDEVWSVDAAGLPLERIDHLAGMWLSANQIEVMFPLAESRENLQKSDSNSEQFRPILSCRRLAVGWRPAHPKGVKVATDEAVSPTAVGSQSLHQGVSQAGSSEDPAPPRESGAQNPTGAVAADEEAA